MIGPNGSRQVDAVQLHPRPAHARRAGTVALDGRDVTGMRPCAAQPPGRQPHLPAAAGLPAADGAREPDPRRRRSTAARGSAACSAPRDAGLGAEADRMIEFFRLGASRRREGGQPVLRPAEAARRRHGVHGRPAPGAARRAGGRRQPDHAGRACATGCARSTARRGATFVVIEHNMEFVMALCTRIIVLAEGRIIAEGSPGRGARQSGA